MKYPTHYLFDNRIKLSAGHSAYLHINRKHQGLQTFLISNAHLTKITNSKNQLTRT